MKGAVDDFQVTDAKTLQSAARQKTMTFKQHVDRFKPSILVVPHCWVCKK